MYAPKTPLDKVAIVVDGFFVAGAPLPKNALLGRAQRRYLPSLSEPPRQITF